MNILEVYISPGCNFTISPIDSIQTNVRLNWTVSQFYASGGTTKFQDRVASALGISVGNVKIVSVYTGSVVIDFFISEDSSGTVSQAGGLDSVQATLVQKLANNSINLGAPLLSFSVSAATATSNTETAAANLLTTLPSVSQTVTQSTSPQANPKVVYSPAILNNSVIIVQTEEGTPKGSTLAAVIVSVVAILLIGSSLSYYFYRRRKGQRAEGDKTERVAQTSRADISQFSPEE